VRDGLFAAPGDAMTINKTITRADLLEVVYGCCPGLSRVQAKDIIEIALDEVCSTLLRGETVKLRGFGSFSVRSKAARVGRNPRTLQEFPITARRVLTFKPSPRLVDAVNGVKTPLDEDEEKPGRRNSLVR
jgi:integration host factor subunit alpha